MPSIEHKRVASPDRLGPDFVLRHVGRLRGQGEERKEIATAQRIGTELAFEASQRVLVLEQCDDDAFRRRMLTLRDPRLPATRSSPDRRRMPSEDVESFDLFAFLEPKSGEPEEHVRPTAPLSQRPSGDRQVYVRPPAWRG